MAIRELRVGSMTDIHRYDDVDFDAAIETTHTIKVGTAPVAAEDVIRLSDLLTLVGPALRPVGSVYLSVSAVNPNILLGFGTWVRIAEGQFLVGQKAADPDFGAAMAAGGSKTHQHDVDVPNTTSDGPSDLEEVDNNLDVSTTNVASANHTHDVDPASVTSGDNSELPPFYTIYAWRRTV